MVANRVRSCIPSVLVSGARKEYGLHTECMRALNVIVLSISDVDHIFDWDIQIPRHFRKHVGMRLRMADLIRERESLKVVEYFVEVQPLSKAAARGHNRI